MSTTATTPTPIADTSSGKDAELRSVDPSLIDVAAEFNPRSTMDDEQLRELTASVRSVGVLQPITVVRAEHDRFRLVVGHRRLAAALAAKLGAVPALVYDTIDEASRLQFAIIENLQREDMNPVDEAQAYQRAITEGALTQKQLASVIGKSASHVSERLRLLKLPDAARALLASGKLPLAAAKPLGVLAALKVPTAPQIVEASARLLADDDGLLEDFLDDAGSVLYVLADDESVEGAPFVYRANAYTRSLPLAGHVDDEVITQLTERMQLLGMRHITLDQADIDAARSYGCLIELESRYTPQRFITDPAFLVDRVTEALNLLEQRKTEQAAAAAAPADPGGSPASTRGGTSAPNPSPAARAAALEVQRAKEREQAEKDRLAAIHANRELGLKLAKQLGSRSFDRSIAELLVRMVLAQNADMAVRGIAYTHEDFHQLITTRQKNGKIRTTFTLLDSHDARKRTEEWVLRPRSAEEVLGRLLQLLVAGVFADERAVAKSKQTHWYPPASATTEPALAKLARKFLPEHFHARAERLNPTPTKQSKSTAAKATEAKPAKRAAKAKQAANAD